MSLYVDTQNWQDMVDNATSIYPIPLDNPAYIDVPKPYPGAWPRYAVVYSPSDYSIYIAGTKSKDQNTTTVVRIHSDDIVLAVVHDYCANCPSEPVMMNEEMKITRYVSVFDASGNVVDVSPAPVVLKLVDKSGNEYYLPVGFPFLVAAVVAAIIGGSIAGGLYAWSKVKESEAKQKLIETERQVVNYALSHGDPQLAVQVLHGTGIRYEASSGGSITNALKDFLRDMALNVAAPILGVMIMVIKWRAIVDLIMDLFSRGTRR